VVNDALRHAMAARGMSARVLAEAVDRDPKSVGRWVAGDVTPHPSTRWAVADVLEEDEMALWPSAVRSAVKSGADREVHEAFPTHSAVPRTVWHKLISDAKREIVFCDVVSYWYWYEVPDLTRILREKAQAGCRVRVTVGDPADPDVRADEVATDIPLTLSSRIEQTLHLLTPLRDVVEVRRVPLAAAGGRSVYRGDDQAVAHWWLHGQMGIDFPALHLRRRQAGGLFDQMAVRHVDALWQAAVPVWPS
jgi:hypothetical protein